MSLQFLNDEETDTGLHRNQISVAPVCVLVPCILVNWALESLRPIAKSILCLFRSHICELGLSDLRRDTVLCSQL